MMVLNFDNALVQDSMRRSSENSGQGLVFQVGTRLRPGVLDKPRTWEA